MYRATKTAIVLTALLLLPACTTAPPSLEAAPPTPLPVVPPSPAASTVTPSPAPTMLGEPFERGTNRATSAAVLAKDAQTTEDWQLVVIQYQRAIDFMRAVPRNHRNYQAAQTAIANYQRQLARAQQQVRRGGPLTTVRANQNPSGGVPLVASAPTAEANAVSIINNLLSQQAAFFTQQKRFASTTAELDGNALANTADYAFSLTGDQKRAVSTAIAQKEGIPSYSGAIYATKDGENTITVSGICVTTQPTKTPPAAPTLQGKEMVCPAGSARV